MRCACGAGFELSARREYEYRRTGKTPKCADCHSRRTSVKVTPALLDWWRRRYTPEELRSLGEALLHQ